MNRLMNHSLAAVFAAVLTLSSIGAIVTVPATEAVAQPTTILPPLA